MTNWVDKQAAELIYLTPTKILDAVRNYFGGVIELDPATQPENPTGALKFFTATDDGLVQPWNESKIFINPPYGSLLKPFLAKMTEVCGINPNVQIIALLPCGARFSTRYWQKDAFNQYLKSICFIKGRVKFLRADGTVAKQNPYDSQIYGYNVSEKDFGLAFGSLGKCFKVSDI